MNRYDHNAADAVDALVRHWKMGKGLGAHMTHIEEIPARQATFGDYPQALHTSIQTMLQRRGMHQLYSHQAQAIDAALGGQHTVVVTPTASGKSLCYHLPVIDALYWGGNSLYLFPTKALSQDQTSELNTLLNLLPDAESTWEAQVYDGDTPPDVRRRIRRNSQLVITNPDMLHAAIMPNHKSWAAFFRKLQYIVIDELHVYRGVFGSHVANVIRRLKRLCEHYEANPTIIATSATIANPQELAQSLAEVPFTLVDQNGAPAPPRTICFLNPPIVDPQQMRRQGIISTAAKLARTTIKEELGTIVFTRSRQSVEILVHRIKSALERDRGRGDLSQRIASYRGGYLPNLRRSIEKGLRDGALLGVISTNALELGIDIGSLDVCVQAGYPGSIASTWQQIGRAGRRGARALSILIASDSPLDQFIIQHPDYFFEQPPEHARIDPDNLRVAVEHLKCACYELPWRHGEAFGQFDAEAVTEMFEFLSHETGMVFLVDGQWRWSDRHYPASEINLRNIAEENFVVVDLSSPREAILAEVDFESAHTSIYPNAVYQVSGQPYRVERLDYQERRAYVRKSDDGHYTTAMHYSAVHVIDTFEQDTVHGAPIGFGEVCVTQRFVGYKKIRFKTGENVGYGELQLPELDLHTMSYWLMLDSNRFPHLSKDHEHWARLVNGMGRVLLTSASLLLMCDPRDLDSCIGSPTQDQWLSESFSGLVLRDNEGQAQLFEPQEDDFTGRIGPSLYNPTIYIYDKYPGGVGFGEGLFEQHLALMTLALDLVSNCPCADGCPSCVGPPEGDRRPIKVAVIRTLTTLAQTAPDIIA